MIAVVKNTGGTNLNSVCNALARIGATFTVTGDADVIRTAEKVVLPGVGAAAHAMRRLNEANLVPVLRGLSQPVLGICLGMQLLFEQSEEGATPCLGIIPGDVRALKPSAPGIRVPHMGWNRLIDFDPDYPLCRSLQSHACVYFVHSFAATMGPWVKAIAIHGQSVPAIVQFKNFFGCQFHPEKSAKAGEVILRNFINMRDLP
ncbi:imidazole glycerol phosphate synthase subunit HisH C26 [Planctomyces bekefii]|uniref:Imidazole glycerol phosphate synthase subunit HisH n=1 Tax=Planctomyces bekefii TaxID=1653850 RepID=A0A5C6MBS5_9PLAN|nr:imidazole glycerol phosphate synthase subunit HisH C26 [Planctomyces bekefii]